VVGAAGAGTGGAVVVVVGGMVVVVVGATVVGTGEVGVSVTAAGSAVLSVDGPQPTSSTPATMNNPIGAT